MKIISIVILILLFAVDNINAHSGKARFHVIIDTDCAPDDLRAISLMLASPEFEIIAITTSDGILKPKEGYLKIKSLLKDFSHEGIPVAYGININAEKSICNSMCIDVPWGNEQNIIIPENAKALNLIENEINNEDEKLIILCLGPLTNIKGIISNSNLLSQIDKILWYCTDIKNKKGTNYKMDTISAIIFLDSNIEKYIVSNNNLNDFTFDNNFLKNINNINNVYAQKIITSHNNVNVIRNIKSGFYKLWDDLLPIYLMYPDLFEINNLNNDTHIITPKPGSAKQIKNSFLKNLNIDYSNENKVFKQFPVNPELFADDIKNKIDEIIKKHGPTEWRAGVLANELHGHLGIYAIVGVKMGVRVRQYFNIGVDEIIITSFAGLKPPISCLNDGLQVGTGGTLGHGLITISNNDIKRPEAVFQFKDRKIKIILKKQYRKIVRNDIKNAIKKYGKLTPDYWKHIRLLAIKYWTEWDRNQIFDITKL